MKITDGERVFLQENDLKVVLSTNEKEKVPEKIKDAYEQKMPYVELTEDEEIKFVNSLEYLLDYDALKYLSLTDTLSMNKKTLIDLNKALKSYEEVLDSNDKESISIAERRLALLRYKEACLKEMIQAKRTTVSVFDKNVNILQKKKHRFGFGLKK